MWGRLQFQHQFKVIRNIIQTLSNKTLHWIMSKINIKNNNKSNKNNFTRVFYTLNVYNFVISNTWTPISYLYVKCGRFKDIPNKNEVWETQAILCSWRFFKQIFNKSITKTILKDKKSSFYIRKDVFTMLFLVYVRNMNT